MRAPTLLLVAAIGLFLGHGIAAAEKVKTNQSTKLLARPGEQAKVLLQIKSGQSMTLLSQDGRWLKVRVKGRTGYVPRSKVDMADDGGIVRNTRRRPFVDGRSKKRGFGGSAPDDRVGADAMGDNSSSSDDEDEEEEAPRPKKAAIKAPVKDEDEDDDEDEDEAPAPKKVTKAPPPKAAAKAKQEDDEDEDEDDADEDEDKPVKAAAKKGGGDDDDEDEDEDAPKKKGGDDEEEDEEAKRPTARVSKRIATHDEPDEESDEGFVVRPTDTLFLGETKGGWTFVENADGDGGWVQSDLLESEDGGGPGKRQIDIRARGGITIIQQGMRTAGSMVVDVPDNYNIGTSSFTIALGGGILIPKGKYLIGGEATYEYSKTLGGGVYYDPDKAAGPMPGANIGIVLHNFNLRAQAGIDFRKKSGMALLGRLGYRYQGFLVADVADPAKNPARLPSEVVKGPSIGAALVIPMLTDKIGLKFALDAMLFGASVTQTKGLEDGTSPSVKAIVLGTGLKYRLKSFDLQAAYDLNYMGIDFGVPLASSTRTHMGTDVKRTDIFHQVTFGIAKGF